MMKFGYLLLACASSQTASASQPQRELQLPLGIVKCDDPDSFGELSVYTEANPMPFCANFGVCKTDYANFPEQPCDCPTGYAGPHCEYNEDEVPACKLKCKNQGICMVGATSWAQLLDNSFRYEVNHDHQYCMCPEGFYGSLCELEANSCGANNFCYNGGNCVVIQKRDGSTSYNCDCTTAGDSNTAFAGEFCEYPASTFCTEETDQNGRHFCVNGGTCQEESRLGCRCEDGFVGPLCEFVDQSLEATSCGLQCKNHGICRKGPKDISVLNKFGLSNRRALGGQRHLGETYSEDFEHCVCPAGYAGLRCEYKINVCPGGDHICLNGGDCSLSSVDGSDNAFTCDCSSAKAGGSLFAGEFCEMESTEYCTVDRMRPQIGIGQDAFCTNKGACLKLVEHGQGHPGCECQKGFIGDHCEFRTSEDGTQSVEQYFLIILLVITVLLMAAAFYFFCKYSKITRHSLANADAFDRSKVSSVKSRYGKANPWRDAFREDDDDDGVISLKSEADESTVHTGYGGRTGQQSETRFSQSQTEHRYSSSVFSDVPLSTTSSVTMDADGVEGDRVVRFSPEQLKAPSFGSSHDDSLHLFNDSNDGSVHNII